MLRTATRLGRVMALLLCVSLAGLTLSAADWPAMRGKGHLGVWEETGILEKFPADGLASRVRWRTPIKGGCSSAAVADGRVFVTDFVWTTRPKGTERALALDEATGKILWTREWEADYTGALSWDRKGPNVTPTVDGGHVYVLGASGMFLCLDAKTGEILWQHDLQQEYRSPPRSGMVTWGFASPAYPDGDLVLIKVNASDAKVVAFNKQSGKEVWRALKGAYDPALAPLTIINSGGTRQLIVWHDEGVASLDPATGRVYWEFEEKRNPGDPIALPVFTGEYLFLSTYYNGSSLWKLDKEKPSMPTRVWRSTSDSEVMTESVHTLMSTAVVIDDYVYGIDAYGQLRCLKLETGERIWESLALTKERARHASAQMIRNGDRIFIVTDLGDLVISKFTPEGHQEISRAHLIQPTITATARRSGPKVIWTIPAFANRHVIIRNDEEIISVSLAADQ